MAKIVQKLLTRNAFLKGIVYGKDSEISSLVKRMKIMREESEQAKKATYLKTVGNARGIDGRPRIPPITGARRMSPTMLQSVIISPTDESKKIEAEELKKKIMGLIDPYKDKICIRGVRKRGDGNIVVEAATDSDLKKIVEHEKLKEGGLTATRSGALNPKIVLFDVPKTIEPNDLAWNVLDQNESLLKAWKREGGREEFYKGFVPRFKIGKRDERLTN